MYVFIKFPNITFLLSFFPVRVCKKYFENWRAEVFNIVDEDTGAGWHQGQVGTRLKEQL
jgi:hypothetical protein